MPDRSAVADLGLADALQARTRGFGSFTMILRIAIATTVSYLVALRFSASVLPIFAPATTLLVVQSSAFSTLGMLAQRVLGTGLGVAAATLYVTYVPVTWWSVFLAVLAALMVSRALPVGLVGQLQLPVAVVFVLALGPGDLATDLWRVADVVIGGIIGVIAVFVAPPRPKVAEARAAVDAYLADIAALLRTVAEGIGTSGLVLPQRARHPFIVDARALLGHVAKVSDAVAEGVESVRFNPRARSLQGELEDVARRRLWATVLATQARALAGSADRLYDREGTPPALPAATLASLLRDLAGLLELVSSDGVHARSEEADAALADRLRQAVAATTDHREVVDVLDSVTVLGRVDQIRTLVAHGPWAEDPFDHDANEPGTADDAEDALGPGERLRRLLGRT
jgi:uncharacterized membrane protein YccC